VDIGARKGRLVVYKNMEEICFKIGVVVPCSIGKI